MITYYSLDKKKYLVKKPKFLKSTKLIHLSSTSKDETQVISNQLKLNRNSMPHILDKNEIPRVKEYSDHTLIIFRSPTKKGTKPFGFILKGETLVAVHKNSFNFVRDYVDDQKEAFDSRKMVSYFILDMVSSFDKLLDRYMEDADELEQKALLGEDIRHDLFSMRKHLIFIRKALRGNKDVLFTLKESILNQDYQNDFLDIKANMVQQLETAALIQERLSEIVNISLTTLSNKLNEIMKTFTVLSLFVMFPTLIAGVYGMNFRFMPEINWKYGYFFAFALMGISVLIIRIYFKKKGWI